MSSSSSLSLSSLSSLSLKILCVSTTFIKSVCLSEIFSSTQNGIFPREAESLSRWRLRVDWVEAGAPSLLQAHSPRQETGWRQIHSARLERRTTGPFLGNEEWKYFEEMYSNVFKTLFVHNIEFLPDHTSLPRYLSQVRNTSDQQFISESQDFSDIFSC